MTYGWMILLTTQLPCDYLSYVARRVAANFVTKRALFRPSDYWIDRLGVSTVRSNVKIT